MKVMSSCVREGRISETEIHVCYFCGNVVTQALPRCQKCGSLICSHCEKCTCSDERLVTLHNKYCCDRKMFIRGIKDSPEFAPFFKAALDFCREKEGL